MTCHLFERALFLHAHNELAGPARILVQSHLAGCDCCRARWASWVVEKDQLRRALAPDSVLDPEGERRLQVISARIRCERQPHGIVEGTNPARLYHGRPVPRRLAPLALAVALLVVGVTALAAAWGPALASVLGMRSTPPAPCPPAILCPAPHGTPIGGSMPLGGVQGPAPAVRALPEQKQIPSQTGGPVLPSCSGAEKQRQPPAVP